jgi:hypothetical protein
VVRIFSLIFKKWKFAKVLYFCFFWGGDLQINKKCPLIQPVTLKNNIFEKRSGISRKINKPYSDLKPKNKRSRGAIRSDKPTSEIFDIFSEQSDVEPLSFRNWDGKEKNGLKKNSKFFGRFFNFDQKYFKNNK